MSGFPFTSVVGQDEARLALVLAAIDPAIGGVLLRGDKGSAKSTLARGLAGVLGEAPFVELPIGAGEEAVVGSLDLGAAMAGEGIVARPGLLARAHGGVLYIDEVNLLPDHLVDVVLDAAASGVHRLERDGVSQVQPARFVLVGSMNPEEGELRPQLLDRFGLAVDVRAPVDPAVRAAAVRARLAFDAGAIAGDDGALAARLATARPAALPDDVLDHASRLALAVGAEGLRADLVLCRAAAALAGWEGRDETTPVDVDRVAPFALSHRRRRRPFDPPAMPPEELQRAIEEANGPGVATGEPDATWGELAGAPEARRLDVARAGRVSFGVRGPVVGDRRPGPDGPTSVAAGPTVLASVRRGAGAITLDDVREPVRREAVPRCIVIAVDASGSMGGRSRVDAATGAVLGLLSDAYRRRHHVALISFAGSRAEVVLPPTASVELARTRLDEVAVGGATPLAEGLEAAYAIARSAPAPLVVVLTDGRATAGSDALPRALAVAGDVATLGIEAIVLDAEEGPTRLGLARQLAEVLGARCIPLDDVSAEAVRAAIEA